MCKGTERIVIEFKKIKDHNYPMRNPVVDLYTITPVRSNTINLADLLCLLLFDPLYIHSPVLANKLAENITSPVHKVTVAISSVIFFSIFKIKLPVHSG